MSDQRPLYQRIRSTIIALILDSKLPEGDPLPSIRGLAAELEANPLTVAKAYATLHEKGIVEARRGVGFFVTSGGKARLKDIERAKFLTEEWPTITSEMKRLDLAPAELLEGKSRRRG